MDRSDRLIDPLGHIRTDKPIGEDFPHHVCEKTRPSPANNRDWGSSREPLMVRILSRRIEIMVPFENDKVKF